MAGFFKKLFNRVTGAPQEAQPAPDEVVPPPPAPEPEAAPERDPDAPADWIMRELLAHEETPAPLQAEADVEPAPPVVVEPPPAVEPPPPVAPAPEPPVAEIPEPEPIPVAPKPAGKAKPAKPEPAGAPVKATSGKAGTKTPAAKPATKAKAAPPAKPPAKSKAKAAPEEKPAPPVAEAVRPAPAPAERERPAPPQPRVEPPAPAPEKPSVAKAPDAPPPVAEPTPAVADAAPAPHVAPPDIVPPPESPAPVQVDEAVPPAALKRGSLVKERAPAQPTTPLPEPQGWLARLRSGLSKSSRNLSGSIGSIFTKKKLDAATLQDLEDALLQADLGLPMAERIIKAVSAGRFDREIDPAEVRRILAEEVAKVLKPVEIPFNFGAEKPFVILVIGVNGSGKTTTIGKLGAIAAGEGFKVMFAACDTFRAAAIEQLTVWGKRIGAKTMSRPTGADASGLAFDAMREAQQDGTDILFIDTAGRLQNKAYLMDELDKVVRVIKKVDVSAPHAVLLVLDATTGQNAMAQAEVFTRVAGVTGLIMTKLDGTARGGILVAIAERFRLPVHAIGVGEQIDDLQPFDADAFARTIAGLDQP